MRSDLRLGFLPSVVLRLRTWRLFLGAHIGQLSSRTLNLAEWFLINPWPMIIGISLNITCTTQTAKPVPPHHKTSNATQYNAMKSHPKYGNTTSHPFLRRPGPQTPHSHESHYQKPKPKYDVEIVVVRLHCLVRNCAVFRGTHNLQQPLCIPGER